MSDVTVWIQRAASGDRAAFDAAFEAIQRELKALAARRLHADPRATLSPTMLVNETWLKLAESRAVQAESRAHFFRIAASAMRQIWIDRQRARGSELERIRLYVESQGGEASSEFDDWVELIDWEQAMQALEQSDPELAELVALRVFSGLELDDIAKLKQVSPRTVQRHWKSARAFLLHAV
jgi:RNA polymerase sigma factor (TIGR02999 family)